jgi:SET domain-containing protein
MTKKTPMKIEPVAQTELVTFAQSPIHGTGGFARSQISAGTQIIEYVGEIISKAESLRRCELNNEYIFALDAERDLDGNVAANPARFLNHSCAPNAEALLEDGRIWIVARRDICAGEEITFNYGYDLTDFAEHPCRCGAVECAGYIVAGDFFEEVRRRRERKATVAEEFPRKN